MASYLTGTKLLSEPMQAIMNVKFKKEAHFQLLKIWTEGIDSVTGHGKR